MTRLPLSAMPRPLCCSLGQLRAALASRCFLIFPGVSSRSGLPPCPRSSRRSTDRRARPQTRDFLAGRRALRVHSPCGRGLPGQNRQPPPKTTCALTGRPASLETSHPVSGRSCPRCCCCCRCIGAVVVLGGTGPPLTYSQSLARLAVRGSSQQGEQQPFARKKFARPQSAPAKPAAGAVGPAGFGRSRLATAARSQVRDLASTARRMPSLLPLLAASAERASGLCSVMPHCPRFFSQFGPNVPMHVM